ncbi:Protein Dr1-like [Vitis vinifera]|uniref:Protein Dr1-like n=1 Tax=Vitis vinifera TaxID=29760 RepID=A0A438JYG7_VITVI|nr:Protein Dr1-like [Vitis vinifera]
MELHFKRALQRVGKKKGFDALEGSFPTIACKRTQPLILRRLVAFVYQLHHVSSASSDFCATTPISSPLTRHQSFSSVDFNTVIRMEPMDIVGKSKEDASLPKGRDATTIGVVWGWNGDEDCHNVDFLFLDRGLRLCDGGQLCHCDFLGWRGSLAWAPDSRIVLFYNEMLKDEAILRNYVKTLHHVLPFYLIAYASSDFSSATMTKIIKEMLPPDVRVARDAQDLLIECCVADDLILGWWIKVGIKTDRVHWKGSNRRISCSVIKGDRLGHLGHQARQGR